jgi:galactitol-specific phosphotransferase system IIC component
MEVNPYQPPLVGQRESERFGIFRAAFAIGLGLGIAAAILASVAFFSRFIVPS